MAGYDNPRYCDIENEVLRSRLSSIKGGAQALIDAVEQYTAPKKGQFLHRSDLLRIKDALKELIK